MATNRFEPKNSSSHIPVLIIFAFFVVAIAAALPLATAARSLSSFQNEKLQQPPDVTVQIAGSSLPDCSHACGSCKPCRLVMVSFICSSLEEAETCPMAYKCMCNSKSYPIP